MRYLTLFVLAVLLGLTACRTPSDTAPGNVIQTGPNSQTWYGESDTVEWAAPFFNVKPDGGPSLAAWEVTINYGLNPEKNNFLAIAGLTTIKAPLWKVDQQYVGFHQQLSDCFIFGLTETEVDGKIILKAKCLVDAPFTMELPGNSPSTVTRGFYHIFELEAVRDK